MATNKSDKAIFVKEETHKEFKKRSKDLGVTMDKYLKLLLAANKPTKEI